MDDSFALPVPQLGENVKLGLREVKYIESDESGKVWLAWLASENIPFTGLITLDDKKNIVEIEIEPKQTDILGLCIQQCFPADLEAWPARYLDGIGPPKSRK